MGWWAGEPLCQGDQGADIIDEAMGQLNAVWKQAWGRRIKKEEVLALIEFCYQEEEDEDDADDHKAEPQSGPHVEYK